VESAEENQMSSWLGEVVPAGGGSASFEVFLSDWASWCPPFMAWVVIR